MNIICSNLQELNLPAWCRSYKQARSSKGSQVYYLIMFNNYNRSLAFIWCVGSHSELSIPYVTPDAINRQGNFDCFICRIRQANLTQGNKTINKSWKYIAMVAYESIKRHKHARRHNKNSEVFLPYYKTPRVWIMKHCFRKVINTWWFTPLVGLKIPGYPSPPLRRLPCPGRLTRPSQCHSRLQTRLHHLLNRLGPLQGQRYA